MYEELIIDGDWMATAANFYNAFLEWFGGLELAGQIGSGIVIILLLVAAGYSVYGVFWLGYHIVKGSLVMVLMVHVLMFVAFKMLCVAIIDSKKMNEQWETSVENMKFIMKHLYPKSCKQNKEEKSEENASEPKIEIKIVQQEPEQPKIMHVKSQQYEKIQHEGLFCTSCGSKFTPRMQSMIDRKEICFCEVCGQMFVAPQKPVEVIY